MISGVVRILSALFVMVFVALPSWAQDLITFDQLSAALTPRANERVSFDEQRIVSYLDQPLQVTGWVRFVPPARFERHITTPVREDFVIDGEQITITDANGHADVLALSDHAVLQVLADGIRATLLGDLRTLNTRFDVAVQGTADAWRLVLSPKDSDLRRALKSMSFAGSGDRFTDMSIVEANGDATRTTFGATLK